MRIPPPFEHIIVATGATWRRDGVGRWLSRPLEWPAGDRVFTPDDIMDGVVPDGPVAIYDDDHYYMASVIARKLRADGAEVTLITPDSTVASFSSVTNEQRLTQVGLLEAGVAIKTSRTISGLKPVSFCTWALTDSQNSPLGSETAPQRIQTR